jgi:CMP-N-acetylneuraminic acid synthetase
MAPRDVVVLIQASSPTRNRERYIWGALTTFDSPKVSACVSVVPWAGHTPWKACKIEDGKLVMPFDYERRQDCPPAYRRDGTVYAVRWEYAVKGDLYGPHPVPLLVDPADSVTLD